MRASGGGWVRERTRECMHVCAYMRAWGVERRERKVRGQVDQMTTWGTQFSPFTTWALGPELGQSHLAAGPFTCSVILLALAFFTLTHLGP